MAEQGAGRSSDGKHQPSRITVPTTREQNVVSTVNLCCELDLVQLALRSHSMVYDPRRYSAFSLRLRNPETMAIIFASGKMICAGAKSEANSNLAARVFVRIIQKLGFPVRFEDFTIHDKDFEIENVLVRRSNPLTELSGRKEARLNIVARKSKRKRKSKFNYISSAFSNLNL